MGKIDYSEIPRRNQLNLCVHSELAICHAIQEVETMGCDKELTDVIIKLQEAKEMLSNYVDKN